MKLGFEEPQSPYSSGSQSARTWTEAWVKAQAYCPHCGNAKMSQFPNNSPVADFRCSMCNEEFELKSQKGKFGQKVADGAYKTKCQRLAASNNPNLLLPQDSRRRKSFHRSKALLRSRHHRRAQTSRGDGAAGWMDRVKYPDRRSPRSRKDSHRSKGRRSSEGNCSSGMAKDAIFEKPIS